MPVFLVQRSESRHVVREDKHSKFPLSTLIHCCEFDGYAEGFQDALELVELDRFFAVLQVADKTDAYIGQLGKTELRNFLPFALHPHKIRKLGGSGKFNFHQVSPCNSFSVYINIIN
nr:MAG TPA: hypothetical protein [Caudoviricetes sp.]